jgi:hypothetical protein
VARLELAQRREQLGVSQRVVQEAEALDHVDVELLFLQDGEDVAGDHRVPARVGAVVGERLVRIVDQLGASLDAGHVCRPRLERRERPSPVMARDVEHPCPREDVGVVRDQCLVAHVQPTRIDGGVTGLEEARVAVEPAAGAAPPLPEPRPPLGVPVAPAAGCL